MTSPTPPKPLTHREWAEKWANENRGAPNNSARQERIDGFLAALQSEPVEELAVALRECTVIRESTPAETFRRISTVAAEALARWEEAKR